MMTWIAENWQMVAVVFLSCLGGLVTILKAVAPLTPTEVDNKVLGWLVRVVEFLSGAVTPKLKVGSESSTPTPPTE